MGSLYEMTVKYPELAEMLACPKLRDDKDLLKTIRSKFGVEPDSLSDDDLKVYADLLDQEELQKKLEIERAAAKMARIEKAVPSLYRGLKAQDFSYMANTYSQIIAGKSFLLAGINGCGKTALAWTVYQDLVEQDCWSGKILTAVSLLSRMKTEVFNNHRELDDVISNDYGKTCRRLFIDEVDKITKSEIDFQYLHAVIDYRYQWRLQTVCLGNGSLQEIREIIGQSAYSRLSGDGAKALVMKPIEWRRKGE